MALVEVIFRDRIAGYTRGQVVTLNSETPFFKAIINGKKAEILNPPDWSPDGESISQSSEVAESTKPRGGRRSRKKSDEGIEEITVYSPEGYGSPGELAPDRESGDSGEDTSEDSVGRPEHQSDPERDSGGL